MNESFASKFCNFFEFKMLIRTKKALLIIKVYSHKNLVGMQNVTEMEVAVNDENVQPFAYYRFLSLFANEYLYDLHKQFFENFGAF